MHKSETSNLPIDRLMRGLKTARVDTVWAAARELRALGPDWYPLLRAKLHTKDWDLEPVGRGDHALGVLLALLDEFDREAFAVEIRRLQRRAVHPRNARMVAVLAQRLSALPVGTVGPDIPVHVADELGDPAQIVKSLTRWARRVEGDLAHVAWVTVVSRHGHDDMSRYNPLFSGIVLTWPDRDLPASEQKMMQMQPEFAFYRAVGHHVDTKADGAALDYREEVADHYATRLFRGAHPLFTRMFGGEAKLDEWS